MQIQVGVKSRRRVLLATPTKADGGKHLPLAPPSAGATNKKQQKQSSHWHSSTGWKTHVAVPHVAYKCCPATYGCCCSCCCCCCCIQANRITAACSSSTSSVASASATSWAAATHMRPAMRPTHAIPSHLLSESPPVVSSAASNKSFLSAVCLHFVYIHPSLRNFKLVSLMTRRWFLQNYSKQNSFRGRSSTLSAY